MPLDGTVDDIDADFDILEAVGEHVSGIIEGLMPGGGIQKTLRRWLSGHAAPPEDEDARVCLMAMAADLELFTPSASGRTAVDRHLRASRPQSHAERQALEALSAARFRLIRIVDREGPDLVRLNDLVTGESLLLLDARISPLAAGLPTAMRLCPLASGRQVVISPLFAMDEAMLGAAMAFARQGRDLGHRCAANLYRDAARRGVLPMPQLSEELDDEAVRAAFMELVDSFTEVDRLALEWIAHEGAGELAELVADARRMACVDNLVDACGLFGRPGAPGALKAAYERIAELQVETMVRRARSGAGGHADALDLAATAIAGYVARGKMEAEAGALFDRLRARWALSASSQPAGRASPGEPDLDRVIQRIRALRSRTTDRGCTEEEALAAAAKVAELLDRHDLTLDEVSVRKSDCEGVSVATGRKRRAPVDFCMPPIAGFCDCLVWSEAGEDDAMRYVFFGLKADIEAAALLHELIEAAFETESAIFRRGEIYLALRGGNRRAGLNSFQIGLANGITAKLAGLKDARRRPTETTGFDLVAVKHSVVDEEIAKLGLDFTRRRTTSRRYVHGQAFAAGQAAGALFEPNPSLHG